MDAEKFEAMLVLLKDYVAVRYTNVAFLILLIYDHILTFDMEVERIWILPWRLPKVLFLFSRYIVPPMLMFDGLTPAIHIGDNLCIFIGQWTTWPTILSIVVVDGLLILRVVAIYSHNKHVVRFLITLLIGMLCSWIGVSMAVMVKTTARSAGELFTGCRFTAPKYFYTAWIPPAFFETVIIILTLYKVIKYNTMPPTLRILARDSMLYFSSVFTILIINLLLARYGRRFLGALLIQPCSAVACVAATRMSMNIRESTINEGLLDTEHQLPTINFSPGDSETTRTSIEQLHSTTNGPEA